MLGVICFCQGQFQLVVKLWLKLNCNILIITVKPTTHHPTNLNTRTRFLMFSYQISRIFLNLIASQEACKQRPCLPMEKTELSILCFYRLSTNLRSSTFLQQFQQPYVTQRRFCIQNALEGPLFPAIHEPFWEVWGT